MKKIFLFLLLIPFSINAKANITSNIECESELKINYEIKCSLILNNQTNTKIKSVAIGKNEKLLDLNSNYQANENENFYTISLDTNESNIEVFNFKFLMEKNNDNLLIENIVINTETDIINQSATKIFTIENIAYADTILINNQPISSFKKDIYNYSIDLYEKYDYVQVKMIASGNNSVVDDETKLVKFISGSTFNLKVTNNVDTEIYRITLNYKSSNDNNKITINEIPFEFNPNKKYYYLECESNIYRISINNGLYFKAYNLANGKNTIYFDNNGETYKFVINRLKSNDSVNKDGSLKSLKIGNTYLNLKKDVYTYDYVSNKLDVVSIETNYSQDYEVTYTNKKITIYVYDGRANKTEYNINIISDNDNSPKEIREYDRTKSLVVFLLFLFSFLLIITKSIKKRKRHI